MICGATVFVWFRLHLASPSKLFGNFIYPLSRDVSKPLELLLVLHLALYYLLIIIADRTNYYPIDR